MATIVHPITEEERTLRQDALREALASLRLEGLELDEESLRTCEEYVEGKTTFAEFRNAIDILNELQSG